LQEQPFQLLLVLLERAGEVVSREELQRRLWPADTFVDFDRGLNRAVNKLREVLGDSSESPRWIETVPRRGYRFVAPVEVDNAQAAPSPHESIPASGINGWVKATLIWGLVTALVLALGLSLARYNRSLPEPPLRSLAVLPLQNLSGDATQEYFADGMTDGLI